ncbi:hypothetical protein KVV02_002045 [Mortierella alpina]|uniref:RING-type domain-containing protein n=7 Tax=Mortierellaceae TaxID=4854 RepID=A0A9P8D058_MORAP|nr:hypothetical protein KVV02_002045 [Mortierella alpina]
MFAMTNIKGVGRRYANLVCKKADIDLKKRAGELTNEELERLVTIMQNPTQYKVPQWFLNRQKNFVDGKYTQLLANGLDNQMREDLERLKKIRAHRGLRHYWGVRVRGQHTKTTGRRGRVVGVSKKKGTVARVIILYRYSALCALARHLRFKSPFAHYPVPAALLTPPQMMTMNKSEQEHPQQNDAPVLSAPVFKDLVADMEHSSPSASLHSSASPAAVMPNERLALELSRRVSAPGDEHELESEPDSQSHRPHVAAINPAATVVAFAALSSLPSSSSSPSLSSPSSLSSLSSPAPLEPTNPPAVLLASSSSSSSPHPPHAPHPPHPPHSPHSPHSLRALHSQTAPLFSTPEPLAQHVLPEAKPTGTLAQSRLRIPTAAAHPRPHSISESLPRRKTPHHGRTSSASSARTPPFVFAETLFISLGHSPFRLFVVTPLSRPAASAATLRLKLESQSFFCCCTPFDLSRCLGYFRTWSFQSLAVAYSIPLLCALTPGLVLPLSIFQVLSLIATTGIDSSSDPQSLRKMDPESSSSTHSRPSSQDREHVYASEGHSHVTMLRNSASQPGGSFGSSSSSSPHQERIPANMHHSAGSSSGAVFRPPSQSFTQHHQDQNRSLSSHSEQQPHPTRFDHTHSHHNQSRSYNSFHDFEEDEDEDRRSDDGSEGEPGFNDIEFWLQRCSICFDARLDFCLEFCRDQFCRECFQRYVKEVVSNSWGLNITKIKCPVCQDTIPLSEWTKYVDRATFAQYNQYNQPYRSFSRYCGGCEQEVVVSEVKRKVIGLPVQDLLPFFEGFLEDLRTLMEVGGLSLEKPPCAVVSSPAKTSLNRPVKGLKNEPEPSERDITARRIVQRFVDDFQALCGVTHGPHPRFPSMAQSYLSSLTLRMGASLSSTAPTLPAPSQQAASQPHQQATSSSGSQVQGSNPNPNPQPTMESTTRLPISIFPRRLTAFSSSGVLELYKTLMVSLLDLFDLNHGSQKSPTGDSIRAQADDIDMVLAPVHESRNDNSTAPAQGMSSDQPKVSTDAVPSGSRTAHHARPRVMTRAMTKQQAAVKRALVRLSKDIASIETRPEQWKELQFLHVRWLRWDWCVNHSEGAEDESEDTAPPNSAEDTAGEGHVRALAVVDGTSVQAESSLNQTGRRRRRSEDASLEVSEKPEIGVPNVFVIQAKRSRA